ncbi:hypothetical protein [Bradyrhizobium sp. SYSU BS000235]|uniref:hypothetical protein n=1 Tax=Bradyrhizobium sp. SYSU BS000235 TaxID=3411332 RepID=UPI003C72BB2E
MSAPIAADTQDVNFPASNLANPATHLEWRAADSTEQYLTVTVNEVDPIDYVGVARHNFGTAAIAVSVEGLIDGVWIELVPPRILSDDSPLMLRFVAQSLAQIRLKMASGSDAARAAVLYVGKLLDLERKVYVGHTPLPHGRKSNIANGMSESGNFLGRIVLGEWRESTVPLSLISPAWFRTYMDPFLKVAKEVPFFFAWRPSTYPNEVGYVWFTDDPKPAPAGPSNLIALDWALSGIT